VAARERGAGHGPRVDELEPLPRASGDRNALGPRRPKEEVEVPVRSGGSRPAVRIRDDMGLRDGEVPDPELLVRDPPGGLTRAGRRRPRSWFTIPYAE